MPRSTFIKTIATILIAGAVNSFAEPGIVYRYSTPPKLEISGVNGIVELEAAMTEPGSGCEQRIADLVVDEVVYEGTSEMLIGFRAKKPANGSSEWYGLFSMATKALYQNLSNAERRNIQQLIRRGAKLIVIYQICGSGGFASVRDVFAKSAVNNP